MLGGLQMTQQVVVLEGRQDEEDRVERDTHERKPHGAANPERAVHFTSIIRPKVAPQAHELARLHLPPHYQLEP